MKKWKLLIPKEELANMSKEDLQERLNKFIEKGYIPEDMTPDNVGPWTSEEAQGGKEESGAIVVGVGKEIAKIIWEL